LKSERTVVYLWVGFNLSLYFQILELLVGFKEKNFPSFQLRAAGDFSHSRIDRTLSVFLNGEEDANLPEIACIAVKKFSGTISSKTLSGYILFIGDHSYSVTFF